MFAHDTVSNTLAEPGSLASLDVFADTKTSRHTPGLGDK